MLLASLPSEILLHIISYIGCDDWEDAERPHALFALSLTCQRLYAFASDLLWRWPEDFTCDEGYIVPMIRALLRRPSLAKHVISSHVNFYRRWNQEPLTFSFAELTGKEWLMAEQVVASMSNLASCGDDESVDATPISQHWMGCLRKGRKDAVYALLLALTRRCPEIPCRQC